MTLPVTVAEWLRLDAWRRALGERGSGMGRHAMLRATDPQRWREIVREFPRISMTS